MLFVILNFDWMQRTMLGGSEPLFVALLFGAFLALRHDRWLLGTLLASLGTTVRPFGIFSLSAIGFALLWRRQWSKFALAASIGAAVGILYAWPLVHYFDDPLANVNRYRTMDWSQGRLFGLPFAAIIRGTILYPAPGTNLLLTFGWIAFVLAGLVAMMRTKSFHEYSWLHPVEVGFAACYALAIFCYNSPYWARSSFPRFALPIVPFVLVALMRWLPKDRRVLWGFVFITPALAAVSSVGIREVGEILRNSLR